MKKTLLSLLIAMSVAPAFATDYYLVVPVQGKTTNYSGIDVSLAAAALPSAQVGVAYSHDFKPHLLVTGDSTYTGYGVAWAALSGIPAGLSFDSKTGVLSGVPTQGGTSTITLSATYKSKSGQKAYQVLVTSVLGVLTADTSADFGNVAVNSNVSRSFTFSNPGTAPATGTFAELTGTDLTLSSNTCGTIGAPVSVAAGGNCALTVAYNPKAPSDLSGSLRVTAPQAAGGPASMTITGKGTGVSFVTTGSPAVSQTFPTSVVTGQTSSTTLSYALKNQGNIAGNMPTPTLSNTTDFSIANTCNNVAANATCALNVSFTPSVTGARSATFALNGVTYTVNGTGIVNPNTIVAYHFNEAVGTVATSVADSKGTATTTGSGATAVTVANGKFGNAIRTYSSTVKYNSPQFAFGYNDFTIQFWFNYNGDSKGDILLIPSGPRLRSWLGQAMLIGDDGYGYVTINLVRGVWQHIALTRSNGNITLWVDGVNQGSAPAGNYYGGTSLSQGAPFGYAVDALIDEFVVTKNVAVYTGNFTPPAAPQQ